VAIVILTGIQQFSAWTLKDVSTAPTIVTLRDLAATANTSLEMIGALGAALVVAGTVWVGRRRFEGKVGRKSLSPSWRVDADLLCRYNPLRKGNNRD
jgi:hypothetical protein